jgi:LysM repeat protein
MKKFKIVAITVGLLVFSTISFSVLANVFAEEKMAKGSVKPELLLGEARGLVERGELLEAREGYLKFLEQTPGHPLQLEARRELEALNIQILFSRVPTSDSLLYEVKAGDTLSGIAKTYGTTTELLMRTNELKTTTIYPGMKLKVNQAKLSVLVNTQEKKLYLKKDEEIIKTYLIAAGTDGLTPPGDFTIVNKLENPTWFHAGAIVPPGSPENILGTRWLGFSIPGYGIHGTTRPESIGTDATAGCIRMYNQDVEELYSIIPVGTTVMIQGGETNGEAGAAETRRS